MRGRAAIAEAKAADILFVLDQLTAPGREPSLLAGRLDLDRLGAFGHSLGGNAALEYAQHIAARTAADIMIAPVSLRANETVRTAFERMHHSHLNGLPIVDDEKRVVGYLDQFELLLVWIRSTGRGALLRPADNGSAEPADG